MVLYNRGNILTKDRRNGITDQDLASTLRLASVGPNHPDVATLSSEAILATGQLNTEAVLNTLPQVVPGLSFPVGTGTSRGEYGVLLYLSFEHPLF